MNRTNYIHIFRLLLIMLLVLVPFKAKAGSNKYARVILHTDTAKGIVYFDDDDTKVETETVTKEKYAYAEGAADVSFTLKAESKEGYKFAGWSETEGGSIISYNSSWTVSVNSNIENARDITPNETREYYAHWTALTRYYARLNAATSRRSTGTGTIKIDGSDVTSLDKSAYGENSAEIKFSLTAVPSEGEFFVGWEEVNGGGEYISTLPTYEYTVTATSTTADSPTGKNIYAVFVNKRPSITIRINGSNYGSGDNIVFNVTKSDSPTTSYTVPLKISTSAQVTIKEVPFGTYSVTPTVWAMNYTVTPVGSNTGVYVTTDTEFEFNVVGKSSTGEYDEKSKVNWGN